VEFFKTDEMDEAKSKMQLLLGRNCIVLYSSQDADNPHVAILTQVPLADVT